CVELLRSAAATGYVPAQAHLGAVMVVGKSVAKNADEGMKLLRAAVATDDPEANSIYGSLMVFELEGGPDGYDDAINHLKRAADAGLGDAWTGMWAAYYAQEKAAENIDMLRKGAADGDPLA